MGRPAVQLGRPAVQLIARLRRSIIERGGALIGAGKGECGTLGWHAPKLAKVFADPVRAPMNNGRFGQFPGTTQKKGTLLA
jgi:hypothetical protein